MSGVMLVLFVYFAQIFKDSNGTYPLAFYLILIIVSIPESALFSTQTVALLSFSTRVSDTLVGGTYITLLNNIDHFGEFIKIFLSYVKN